MYLAKSYKNQGFIISEALGVICLNRYIREIRNYEATLTRLFSDFPCDYLVLNLLILFVLEDICLCFFGLPFMLLLYFYMASNITNGIRTPISNVAITKH